MRHVQDELMTMPEVSKDYRVPMPTLRFYRHRGDIGPKSFRLGRRVFYKRSDVEAWVEQQYAEATGAGAA